MKTHGGVIARGSVHRSVTVNLIALRRLECERASDLRRYILGLALVAATAPLDGFLRAGCLLTLKPGEQSVWYAVERTGERNSVEPDRLSETVALEYAQAAASTFGVGESRQVTFRKELAEEAVAEAKKKKTRE